MKRLLLLLLFILHCNIYYNLVTDKIELKNSSSSRDEAVITFLQAVADNDWTRADQLTFDKEEYLSIYHPAIREFPSIVSKMTAEEAWPMVELRRQVGLDKLRQKLTGKKITKVEYMYRKGRPEYQRLGNLLLWMPDAIKVYYANGEMEIIEQISTIAENHGRYKVSALKTG